MTEPPRPTNPSLAQAKGGVNAQCSISLLFLHYAAARLGHCTAKVDRHPAIVWPAAAPARDSPRGLPSVAGQCTVPAVHTLYLLRHAKSSWSDPMLADHERPLSRRGRRDAKRIADHLLRLGIGPALVLCSTSRRTRETLELVRPALDDATVSLEPELYAASAETLLERLHDVPDDVASVMLIGHNPGLEDIALLVASDGIELGRLETKFPTAALATLTLPTASWQRMSEADAVLAAYVVPKELAEPGARRRSPDR